MILVDHFYIFDNVGSTGESDLIKNSNGDKLIIQIDGDAAGFSIQLKGNIIAGSNNFYGIAGVDLALQSSDTIDKNGIYTFNIEGIPYLKLDLASISSGSLSAYAEIIKKY